MAFRLQQHPRLKNKPFRCKSGLHGPWKTVIVAGRPMLVCDGCGAMVFKDVKEHTYKVGNEGKLFKPHEFAMKQRNLLLRKRILEAMNVDH